LLITSTTQWAFTLKFGAQIPHQLTHGTNRTESNWYEIYLPVY
jgi:hypothetical protein